LLSPGLNHQVLLLSRVSIIKCYCSLQVSTIKCYCSLRVSTVNCCSL